MRWPGESPSASVSPLVNPMRISMTSGEVDVRVPSFMRRPSLSQGQILPGVEMWVVFRSGVVMGGGGVCSVSRGHMP